MGLRMMARCRNTRPFSSVNSVSFPGEPAGPRIVTPLPGPNTVKYLKELGTVTCNLSQHFPVDLHKSVGNYISDTDGNLFLDVFNSIACVSLGYNHPALLEVAKSDLMVQFVTTRTALGINPPKEYIDVLQRGFLDVAPPGLTRISPMMCGSCAIEGAYKAAFFAYAKRQRGERVTYTDLELSSCMKNEAPGSPKYGILRYTTAPRPEAVCHGTRPAPPLEYSFRSHVHSPTCAVPLACG